MSCATAAKSVRADRAHQLGVALMIASAVAMSSAGYFTRLIALDAPALLFWRGIFSGLTIALFVAWQRRGKWRDTARAMGWQGVVLGALGSTAMITFIWSLRLSSVAEVSVIYAMIPLATAALGRVLLGERAGWAMLAAGMVTLAGIAVMMSGGEAQAHWLGDLFAVGMVLASALFMVALRWRRATPTEPAMAVAALATAVIMLPWAQPMDAAPAQIAWSALFGFFQNGVGLILMVLGSRYVTAAETALYGALDAPLAPLWVWLAFAEIPSSETLLGGGIVVCAVVAFVAWGQRRGNESGR